MKEIVSLIQTILWVGLIGGIVWRYHKQIHALLEAIRERIESGSGIKAGPFELASQMQPQDPEQQKKKLAQEMSEASEDRASGEASVSPLTLPPGEDLQTRYTLAEDLALRAIQAEYGVPIGRHLQIGLDLQIDGFFTRGGMAHIVEVRYTHRPYSVHHLQQIVDRILGSISRHGWKNVKAIVAIVYGDDSIDVEKDTERLLRSLGGCKARVDIRCFGFQQLAHEFGVSP